MNPLSLGRLHVSAVVERAGPTRPTWLLPDAEPAAVERHREWLVPYFLDDKGRFLQSIHTFVVRGPGLTLLVDTCVGNDKDRGGRQPFHMMHTSFLEDLRAAGVAPESVDVVLCTHLHVDHVGWNTRLDHGRWVPTFPRARYLFARREWEHWLEPTPGHTPGHVSVRLRGGDAEAVITGDLMHHPIQMAEPDWCSHFDVDPDQARKTRRGFCERYADRPVMVLGTHFHHPTAGRIVRHGETWRLAAP
jgi:glyoxylase-like metal-dependent hydrolase (beta-lactamase superfamily II)